MKTEAQEKTGGHDLKLTGPLDVTLYAKTHNYV